MSINQPFPTPERDLTTHPIGIYADETDDEKIIRQAAEILARRGEQKPVEPIPPKSIPEGESVVIHVLTTFSTDGYKSRPHERGATVVVSFDSVNKPDFWNERAGTNRFDDLLSTGTAIRLGPWPSFLPAWTFGSREWAEQRAQAVAEARAHRDPEERTIALESVERVYGAATFNPQTAEAFYRATYARPEAAKYFSEEQGR